MTHSMQGLGGRESVCVRTVCTGAARTSTIPSVCVAMLASGVKNSFLLDQSSQRVCLRCIELLLQLCDASEAIDVALSIQCCHRTSRACGRHVRTCGG